MVSHSKRSHDRDKDVKDYGIIGVWLFGGIWEVVKQFYA